MGSVSSVSRVSSVNSRWRSGGFALALVVAILAAVVLVTEHRVGADDAGRRGTADIARALRGSGVEVAETGQPVQHASLSVPGSLLWVSGVRVEVFVYPDNTARVADEQRLVRQLHPFLRAGANAPAPHITSVDNVLLLVGSDDPALIRTIGSALRSIAQV